MAVIDTEETKSPNYGQFGIWWKSKAGDVEKAQQATLNELFPLDDPHRAIANYHALRQAGAAGPQIDTDIEKKRMAHIRKLLAKESADKKSAKEERAKVRHAERMETQRKNVAQHKQLQQMRQIGKAFQEHPMLRYYWNHIERMAAIEAGSLPAMIARERARETQKAIGGRQARELEHETAEAGKERTHETEEARKEREHEITVEHVKGAYRLFGAKLKAETQKELRQIIETGKVDVKKMTTDARRAVEEYKVQEQKNAGKLKTYNAKVGKIRDRFYELVKRIGEASSAGTLAPETKQFFLANYRLLLNDAAQVLQGPDRTLLDIWDAEIKNFLQPETGQGGAGAGVSGLIRKISGFLSGEGG